MEKKLDLILSRLDKIEAAMDAMKLLREDVETLKTNVDGVIQSQEFINVSFENYKKITESLVNKNTELEKEMLALKKNEKEKNAKIKTLMDDLNNLEQYGRRMMVDVRGIPREKTEDHIIKNLAKLTNSGIDINDIDITHRTSSSNEASIIVKFTSRKARDMFFKSKKNLKGKTTKDLGYKQENKIFINESLTAQNGDLLRTARSELLVENGYQYARTVNGNVFVRYNENSPKTHVKSKMDIHDLKSKMAYID